MPSGTCDDALQLLSDQIQQEQGSYILSVVRRDDEHPTPRIQHYKLIIAKKDGSRRNSVYEIEGSEESFSDITKLLKFYQVNPFTRSKRYLGKAYVKPRSQTQTATM